MPQQECVGEAMEDSNKQTTYIATVTMVIGLVILSTIICAFGVCTDYSTKDDGKILSEMMEK